MDRSESVGELRTDSGFMIFRRTCTSGAPTGTTSATIAAHGEEPGSEAGTVERRGAFMASPDKITRVAAAAASRRIRYSDYASDRLGRSRMIDAALRESVVSK